MSALMQGVPPRRVGGSIRATGGVGLPDHFANGLPYEADGALSYDSLNPIDHYHQGLPFSAIGRLSFSNVQAVAYFGSGATPFDAAGKVTSISGGDPDHYSSGVGYGFSNQLTL